MSVSLYQCGTEQHRTPGNDQESWSKVDFLFESGCVLRELQCGRSRCSYFPVNLNLPALFSLLSLGLVRRPVLGVRVASQKLLGIRLDVFFTYIPDVRTYVAPLAWFIYPCCKNGFKNGTRYLSNSKVRW